MPRLCLLAAALAALTSTAAPAGDKKQLWVYTSIYKEYAAPLKAAFEKAHPDVEVQIFQGGSEKIQAKVEAELSAGRPQADLLLTSDPFWSQELERRGLLAPAGKRPVSEVNYYSLVVLVVHKDLPAAQRPASFADLGLPRFKGLLQMGSPLESGTTFTAVAYLQRKYGWPFFERLRDNRIASAGGNSTVIQKVESGEKKTGMVLLENALAAKKRGSPIEIVYPSDGSIPVPSVQVILKDAKQPEAAAAFADFLLSKEGQTLLRDGYMYSVRPDVPPVEGAPKLDEVTAASTKWTPEILREVGAQAKELKKKFAALILE
jgi:iron(III) transport system substrate-binding protein